MNFHSKIVGSVAGILLQNCSQSNRIFLHTKNRAIGARIQLQNLVSNITRFFNLQSGEGKKNCQMERPIPYVSKSVGRANTSTPLRIRWSELPRGDPPCFERISLSKKIQVSDPNTVFKALYVQDVGKKIGKWNIFFETNEPPRIWFLDSYFYPPPPPSHVWFILQACLRTVLHKSTRLFSIKLAFVQAHAFDNPITHYNYGDAYGCIANAVRNILGEPISQVKIEEVGQDLYFKPSGGAVLNGGIPSFLVALFELLGLHIKVRDEIELEGDDDPTTVIKSFNCPKAVWAHVDVAGPEPNHDMAIRLWRGRYYIISEGKKVLLRTFVASAVHPITHLCILE